MMINKYMVIASLFVYTNVRGAAEDVKLELRDCFNHTTVVVPGAPQFYKEAFIVKQQRSAFPSDEPIDVRAAIISGPDEKFVTDVAQNALHMGLEMPGGRLGGLPDTDELFTQRVIKQLIGQDVTRIPLAKQTAITLLRGRYALLVPEVLKPFLKDLEYCDTFGLSNSKIIEMLAAYMQDVTADSQETHHVPVLTVNRLKLEAYVKSLPR